MELPPEESAHLVRVLRLKAGTNCTGTDGNGNVFRAVLEIADPKRASVVCSETVASSPPPPLSLAQAVLKNRGMEDVLDLCAQTPLREFQPIWSEHVQVPRNRDIDHQIERLRAKAVSALQQSKQAWLCRILPPLSLERWLEEVRTSGRDLLVCDPSGPDRCETSTAWVAVGPEGGFSTAELAEFSRSGAKCLGLGPSRLRAVAAGFRALARIN